MRRFAQYLAAVLLAAAAGLAQDVNFSREVRPILSEYCSACHGPDEGQRKAKLRLDTREGAFAPREDGKVTIKPGDSAGSELIKRILTEDPDDKMPPEKTGKKLSAAQIDTLKRWIDSGAKWETHWAFQKPLRPELPALKNTAWPKNEIDHFTLAKMEKEGLSPSPDAQKHTLARRASLDLTGLPPSIEEVDAFLADGSNDAYNRLVDRLLDSPHYGEQMARYWLDGARYADSHGYHIDSPRSIWKYREWVVDAFNRNLAFDQFTVEQIAGDLLPNATTEQKIASGFVRCNMSTGEGGAIEDEYRAKYAFDRVETMGTVWLGLTMTCARCHTHKYDPITQKEYYQLYAFFNNLDEPVMDGNKPNPDPFLKIPSKEQGERLAWLKDSISKAQEKLEAPIAELDSQQPGWQKKWHQALSAAWTPLSVQAERSIQTGSLQVGDDHTVKVQASPSDEVVWHLSATLPAGQVGGLRLQTLPDEKPDEKAAGIFRLVEIEIEIIGPGADSKPQKLAFDFVAGDTAESPARNAVDGKADTFWTVTNSLQAAHLAAFVLKEPRNVAAETKLVIRLRLKDAASERAIRRFRLSAMTDSALLSAFFPVKIEPWKVIGPFKAENPATGLLEEYPPEKGVDLNAKYPGVRDQVGWNAQPGYEDGKSHVFVHELHGVHGAYYFHRAIQAAAPGKLDVSLQADDFVRVWFNGKQVAERDRKWSVGEAPLRLSLDLSKGENQLLVKVVNLQGECRFRFDKFLMHEESLPTPLAAILAATAQPAGDEAKQVRNHYRSIKSPDWKQTSDNLALWREEQDALDRSIPTTLVAKESSNYRDTFMLMRGEYDKPADKVSRGALNIFPFPSSAPTNRLGLAQWLVHPDNPLTARVLVNRFWQQYFGLGLVKTTEDFGMQSDSPSHPELLDWLATEFIKSGWNIKHLQRLILTSATYRQSSAAPASLYARDPENRLLARGPRFRIDAEVLRDTALALGGLLVPELGGRSIKPFQPPGLWEAVSYNNAQKYEQDRGPDQYRRSLYIYWKRQSPPPNMLLFDAPTREYCVVRRPRTNTPLQALALLNDPQLVEASRGFAWRMLGQSTDDRARLAYGFKLATCRNPASDELQVLEDFLRAQRDDYTRNPAAADKLLALGTWQPGSDIARPELAAWTTLANMILNLDETVTKN